MSGNFEVCPIPPIYECTWEAHQKISLYPIISTASGLPQANFCILTLYDKLKAVSLGKFILGSYNSRYKSSYMVMVAHPTRCDELHLARIEYFAKVCAVQTLNEVCFSIWIACVRFHFQHEYREWFGGPNEIWSSALLPDCYFIPLICIKCHVAFCETQLDFGTGVEQRVLVVSPLSQ